VSASPNPGIPLAKPITPRAASPSSPQRDGYIPCPDRQITLHPIAYRPTDHTPGMQVEKDGRCSDFIMSE